MRSGSRHRGEAGGGWSGFPPLLATDGRIHKGDCDMTGAIFARGSCRAFKSLTWLALVGGVMALGAGAAMAQPGPPRNLKVSVTGADMATLTWDAPSGGDTVHAYQYRSWDTSGEAAAWATDNSNDNTSRTQPLTSLPSGARVRFEVRACGAGDPDPASTPASDRRKCGPAIGSTHTLMDPLAAPTTVTATPGNGQVVLTWSAVTDAVAYEYRYGTSSTVSRATWMRKTGARRVVIGDLTNAEEYTFAVRTVNAAGGVSATPTTATATPAGLPSAPRNLQLELGQVAGGAQPVTLTWDAPLNDGGATIDGYDYRKTGDSWTRVSGGGSAYSYTDSIDPEVEYVFEVRAVNATGAGPAASTDPLAGALTFTPTTQADIPATVGTALTAVMLPAASGGTGSISYMTTAPPAGLTFTAGTRTISGTPTGPAGPTAVTYTATDGATPAATASLMFNIVVAAAGTTPTTTTGTDGVISKIVVGDPKTDAPNQDDWREAGPSNRGHGRQADRHG